MTDALKLHHDALVIDGLVYHCDGDVTDLKAGGIDALNITVCHFEADFPQACAEIARWHGIINRPTRRGCRSRRLPTSIVPRPRARIGLIMGRQNTAARRRRARPPVFLPAPRAARHAAHLQLQECLRRRLPRARGGGPHDLRPGRHPDHERDRHRHRSLACRAAHHARRDRGLVTAGPHHARQCARARQPRAQQDRRHHQGSGPERRRDRRQHLWPHVLGPEPGEEAHHR